MNSTKTKKEGFSLSSIDYLTAVVGSPFDWYCLREKRVSLL